MSRKRARNIDYKGYLQLPGLLSAQRPVSSRPGGGFAHDEMLFIIVHQTYELWFKQVLFELDRVQGAFSHKTVADKDLRVISAGLDRINEIAKHLVRQIDILETMTPLDFLDFRHVFRSASGFQSLQFRELEMRLGLKAEDRIVYNGRTYDSFLSKTDQKIIRAFGKRPSLYDQLDGWLSRTPFVEMGGFSFWQEYRKAVVDMIGGDRKTVASDTRLNRAAREAELAKLSGMQKMFDGLFQPEGKGTWRLSRKALQAALFIHLYRDQPVLQIPFRILSALMDLDETLALWRYRHALMVQRMLGMKMGSGGSSGHDYLVETTQKHRIFKDLFALSTFLIPRSKLPVLPRRVEEKMGFKYWEGAADAA